MSTPISFLSRKSRFDDTDKRATKARVLLDLSRRESDEAKALRDKAKDRLLPPEERSSLLRQVEEKLDRADKYTTEAKRLVED